MSEDDAALTRLAERLQRAGLDAHVRDWPKNGPVLSVLVNLAVQHSNGFYRWREGKAERQHPDHDPDGAAEELVALCRRLRGPSFHLGPHGGG